MKPLTLGYLDVYRERKSPSDIVHATPCATKGFAFHTANGTVANMKQATGI
jgi:hypothetical protein